MKKASLKKKIIGLGLSALVALNMTACSLPGTVIERQDSSTDLYHPGEETETARESSTFTNDEDNFDFDRDEESSTETSTEDVEISTKEEVSSNLETDTETVIEDLYNIINYTEEFFKKNNKNFVIGSILNIKVSNKEGKYTTKLTIVDKNDNLIKATISSTSGQDFYDFVKSMKGVMLEEYTSNDIQNYVVSYHNFLKNGKLESFEAENEVEAKVSTELNKGFKGESVKVSVVNDSRVVEVYRIKSTPSSFENKRYDFATKSFANTKALKSIQEKMKFDGNIAVSSKADVELLNKISNNNEKSL